jgi:hypothetical protein
MAEVNLLAKDLNDAAQDPNANLDPLNAIIPSVLKVTDASSAHVNVDVVQFAIGALADQNFHGDPGARLPDIIDWTNFVGSLQYNLSRLRDRVVGPRR